MKVEKLQNLLGQYEQFSTRYMDVVQDLQETDNRFRCETKPAYGKIKGEDHDLV